MIRLKPGLKSYKKCKCSYAEKSYLKLVKLTYNTGGYCISVTEAVGTRSDLRKISFFYLKAASL